jgi:hypothetical protein
VNGIRFSEVDALPAGLPGLYEVVMLDGTLLKVGIGNNLRKRLMNHRRSPDSGLRLKNGGDWSRPDDVVCKCSILGKHLYYDEEIAPGYNLKTQAGRQQFLEERCRVCYRLTATKDEARNIERQLEATGKYRYLGKVGVRRPARKHARQPDAS